MGQEALPFGTPSEPGDDPLADAIERALADAGLQAGGGLETESPVAGEPDATWVDASGPDDD